VSLQIVAATISVHAPDLEGHVIRAGRQQLALRTPLDCIHLVCVSFKGLDGFIYTQPAHMYPLIRTARGKGLVCLPVHIQGWSTVKGKLLGALARGCVPDDRRLVHASREDVVAALVPLQSKDRTLVLSQSRSKSTVGFPNSGVTIVAAGGEQGTIALQKRE